MTQLFPLTCPACGASLQIAGDSDQFQCGHCSNRYLLDQKVSEMDVLARDRLFPVITYTQTLGQWLRVAEYDLILYCAETKKVGEESVFYIDVAYENRTAAPVKYRHDQWIIFDSQGHTFEPIKDFTHPHLYVDEKFYLGMTRVLNPGMKLRGWLAFVLPESVVFEYLQFSGGVPVKTVEFRIAQQR